MEKLNIIEYYHIVVIPWSFHIDPVSHVTERRRRVIGGTGGNIVHALLHTRQWSLNWGLQGCLKGEIENIISDSTRKKEKPLRERKIKE